jgi:ATP-binding cassette subfamily C protein
LRSSAQYFHEPVPYLKHIARLLTLMRWRVAIVVALLGGTGFLEGTGLLLLVPLLGAVGLDVQQGAIGRLASLVLNAFGFLGLTPTLPLVLGIFLAVNVALALLRHAHTLFSASFEQDVTRRTSQDLYAAIVGMDWLPFTKLRASDLTVALTTESERTGLAASQVLSIAASAIVTAVYVGVAWRLSPSMTVAVFLSGAVLLVLLRRRTDRAAELGESYSDAVQDVHGAVTDDLSGMKTIRSFAEEHRSLARFRRLVDRLYDVRLANTRNYANAALWLNVGSYVVLTALVFVAAGVLRLEASALLILLFLFGRIMPRLASLQQNVHFYASLLPSVERVARLQASCLRAAVPEAEAASAPCRPGVLQMESVSFRYLPEGPETLCDVSLTIGVGATVAIVGASGAGKTTLVDLIMGLLAPASGRIFVDGSPCSTRVDAWRREIAYVPQDTFLFHGTIRANLQWAVAGATDTDLASALTMAAADFVFDLPDGLDTVVGDRGVRLSGGERQRLALARALLRRPWLLVLDEATSALDSENERRIFEAIERLHGHMTIVLITHRVSTVSGADIIHVLDAGRLVESGSWEALLSTGTRFRELCRAQGVLAAAPVPY